MLICADLCLLRVDFAQMSGASKRPRDGCEESADVHTGSAFEKAGSHSGSVGEQEARRDRDFCSDTIRVTTNMDS